MNLEKKAMEFKNGNTSAFDDLYYATKDFARVAIYSYVQDADTIEDLLQDTFMKVTKQIQSFNTKSFKNWVFTIAKNTAIDYVRSKRTVPLSETFELPEEEKNPCLRFALAHLTEVEREIFLLKVLCGHTTKKIADTLGIKVTEVNQIYYQAKDKLKRELEVNEDEI